MGFGYGVGASKDDGLAELVEGFQGIGDERPSCGPYNALFLDAAPKSLATHRGRNCIPPSEPACKHSMHSKGFGIITCGKK